jgi:hypothetical protein
MLSDLDLMKPKPVRARAKAQVLLTKGYDEQGMRGDRCHRWATPHLPNEGFGRVQLDPVRTVKRGKPALIPGTERSRTRLCLLCRTTAETEQAAIDHGRNTDACARSRPGLTSTLRRHHRVAFLSGRE